MEMGPNCMHLVPYAQLQNQKYGDGNTCMAGTLDKL